MIILDRWFAYRKTFSAHGVCASRRYNTLLVLPAHIGEGLLSSMYARTHTQSLLEGSAARVLDEIPVRGVLPSAVAAT